MATGHQYYNNSGTGEWEYSSKNTGDRTQQRSIYIMGGPEPMRYDIVQMPGQELKVEIEIE